MKTLCSIMVAVLLASASSLSCFAATDTLEDVGAKDISVFVNVVSSENPNLYTPTPDEDGTYRFTTQNDVSFSVTPDGDEEDKPPLAVYEVPATDADALAWLDDCIGDRSDHCLYYDISIEDAKETEQNVPANLVLDLPNGYNNATVGYINTDGSVTTIDSEWNNGKLSFRTDEDGIYAIMYEYGDIDTPIPPTADGIVLLLTVSLAAIVTLLIVAKKSKKDDKKS